MTDRAAFLAERKLGIGGSDIAALYSIEYSCRRRLFYDKRDTPADFPREETKAMRLGTFMEEFAAQEYARETGRDVDEADGPTEHAGGVIRVNVDRIVWDKDRNNGSTDPFEGGYELCGVLEIKSMGREMFYRTKREGLSKSYVLQLQAGMIAFGATWGSFAILSRDSGDLIHFDLYRDDKLCESIVEDAEIFWAQVLNGPIPDALEPDDRRCQQCEFRVTCQGNALVELAPEGELVPAPELLPLVAQKIERDALYDEAVELCEETDEELKTRLGDRQAVIVGDRSLYHRPQKGKTLYKGKELLGAYRKARSWMQSVVDKLPNEDAMAVLNDPDFPVIPPPESFLSESKPSRPLRLMPPKGGK